MSSGLTIIVKRRSLPVVLLGFDNHWALLQSRAPWVPKQNNVQHWYLSAEQLTVSRQIQGKNTVKEYWMGCEFEEFPIASENSPAAMKQHANKPVTQVNPKTRVAEVCLWDIHDEGNGQYARQLLIVIRKIIRRHESSDIPADPTTRANETKKRVLTSRWSLISAPAYLVLSDLQRDRPNPW